MRLMTLRVDFPACQPEWSHDKSTYNCLQSSHLVRAVSLKSVKTGAKLKNHVNIFLQFATGLFGVSKLNLRVFDACELVE